MTVITPNTFISHLALYLHPIASKIFNKIIGLKGSSENHLRIFPRVTNGHFPKYMGGSETRWDKMQIFLAFSPIPFFSGEVVLLPTGPSGFSIHNELTCLLFCSLHIHITTTAILKCFNFLPRVLSHSDFILYKKFYWLFVSSIQTNSMRAALFFFFLFGPLLHSET